ncbi:PREDICTED: MYB-like transcription factor ETC1 [Ipomoea nil]|uniref:MYB-like transcription factor ETC1 n=1 Tax=Ipomoea nil TaxID=35883 RepID=UPI0001CADEF1|nr:PREDICTED: MYB-like transcription factor ETC1 [Ipomoea nil]
MADLDNSSTCGEAEACVEITEVEVTSQDSNKLVFSVDEEALVVRMYNLVGERWSLIAGRIPGRSAEEIEKYWNSTHSTSHQ